MKVEWHSLARKDLAELLEYIADDNPDAAYRVHEEVDRQIGLLAQHAGIGRPGRLPGTRELVIAGTPYIAAYRVAGGDVSILRVMHGARMWPRGM